MGVHTVADLKRDGPDVMGVKVVALYGFKPPDYAVYRTSERVLVQYADAPPLANEQRKALACLNPVRGQINGLVDGWRQGRGGWIHRQDNLTLKCKAERYDRRGADALIVALEGDVSSAQALLEEIKKDILDERISLARIEYLATALIMSAALMLVRGHNLTRSLRYRRAQALASRGRRNDRSILLDRAGDP